MYIVNLIILNDETSKFDLDAYRPILMSYSNKICISFFFLHCYFRYKYMRIHGPFQIQYSKTWSCPYT